MYLSNLKLWNFRKYGSGNNIDLKKPDLDLPFRKGLNVLIGENDSGKTAIIDAIKLVLKTHSAEWVTLDEDDFYKDTNRLRVECEFKDLEVNEAKNFPEYLSWEEVGGVKKPYLRVFIDVGKKDDKPLPYDTKAGLDEEGISISAEAREKIKVTYLKPLRDAKSELIPRKNSRLSQILKTHPAFRAKGGKHQLKSGFESFNKEIRSYFKGKDGKDADIADQEGKILKSEIDKYLAAFSGKSSEFKVSEGDLKQILERLELAFENDKNLGLGSHNILFISAELLHLNKQNWDGLRLGLIEEIEAHLHPQIQLKVIEKLQQNEKIQLILTTHSPNIGSKVKLEKLMLCYGNNVFPLGKSHTKLEEEDYKFLERFLDVTKSNLFFAKGVILVEGWGEEILLPTLARRMGVNLPDRGVSIINIANTAFLRYSKIFQRSDNREFKMPVAVITDLDVKPADEKIDMDGQPKSEKQKEGKEKKYSGGSVKTFVSPHWTLEYCIALSPLLREHLFKAIKNAAIEEGKTFEDTWDAISDKKTAEQVAEKIYVDYVSSKGKKNSKAIIAQQFASILEGLPEQDLTAAQLEAEVNINYLISAIKYAAAN